MVCLRGVSVVCLRGGVSGVFKGCVSVVCLRGVCQWCV